MKITEYKNEEALDLLADILEPVSRIFADENLAQLYKSGQIFKLVQSILKNHPKDIVEVLARMDGVPVEEYNGTIVTMTASLLTILNDEELKPFFQLQELTKTSSISAMANTKAKRK